MDLQHKAFTIYLEGALYRAPIGRPGYVLDIATGTGIWAIKFAQEHPQATVIGTDLSMIQPSEYMLQCIHVFGRHFEFLPISKLTGTYRLMRPSRDPAR